MITREITSFNKIVKYKDGFGQMASAFVWFETLICDPKKQLRCHYVKGKLRMEITQISNYMYICTCTNVTGVIRINSLLRSEVQTMELSSFPAPRLQLIYLCDVITRARKDVFFRWRFQTQISSSSIAVSSAENVSATLRMLQRQQQQ